MKRAACCAAAGSFTQKRNQKVGSGKVSSRFRVRNFKSGIMCLPQIPSDGILSVGKSGKDDKASTPFSLEGES